MLPVPVMEADVVGGSAVGAEPGTMELVVNVDEAGAVRDIVPKKTLPVLGYSTRDGIREGGAIDRADLQSQHPPQTDW